MVAFLKYPGMPMPNFSLSLDSRKDAIGPMKWRGLVADCGAVARGNAVARLFGPPTGRAREREVLWRPVAAVGSRELPAFGLRNGN